MNCRRHREATTTHEAVTGASSSGVPQGVGERKTTFKRSDCDAHSSTVPTSTVALGHRFPERTTNRMLQGRTRTGPKPVHLRSRALPVVGARRVEVQAGS
eukprot:scaffold6390_cov62-Phaeocystis_antarctica.AAC.1